MPFHRLVAILLAPGSRRCFLNPPPNNRVPISAASPQGFLRIDSIRKLVLIRVLFNFQGRVPGCVLGSVRECVS